jgi:hypothetical protein
MVNYVGIKDVPPNISLAESGNLTQTGMGSDFQFWLLFSFYLFSVCLFFFVFFINLIKLLQFF